VVSDVFLPTEWLMGLYDGGLGGRLGRTFWESYLPSKSIGAEVSWVFADEAILRKELRKANTIRLAIMP